MAFYQLHQKTEQVEFVPSIRYNPYSCPDYNEHQDLAGRIDPLLQYSAPCSDQQSNLFGTSGMQRFLQEPQSTFFHAQHNDPMQSTHYTGVYPDMGSCFYHNLQMRHESPIPRQQPSTTGGPRSPPLTDNDAYVDSTQGPSTPPDAAVLSPGIISWDAQSPSVLNGLSNIPEVCINPSAIQPSQDLPDTREGEELGAFALDSIINLDDITPTSIYRDGSASPISPTKAPDCELEPQDEINNSYPEPQDMDVDIEVESEIAVDTRSNIADDDDEYKPNCRPKASRAAKGNSRRGRPKRSSFGTRANRTKVTKPHPPFSTATARRLLSISSGSNTICPHCEQTFTDNVLLQKHINALHKRPFTCVFRFAGCDKVFANKNEWKRHVSAQHLNPYYWLCTTGACGHSPNHGKGGSNTPTHCRIFRRKDLFTQHIRRMHAPPNVAKAEKKDKNLPADWMVEEKKLQAAAFRQRCKLPNHMRCPAKGCETSFDNGSKTWDDRMEHVAVHLERAANNEEPAVVFGGFNDNALTEWASQSSVRVIVSTPKGWKTCQPLKAARTELSKVANLDQGLDKDAGEGCC
ncbi:hypothetical protein F66182_10507 [Fusarium sp. NRRL 66182]|nr:hypothetical protein F66182_10507 [Fusarium sp. NRRL 66182]